MNSPFLWPQFDQLPLEIWGEIAAVSDRQTVASLCALSRTFRSISRPVLYSDMAAADPPLSSTQTRLLVDRLRYRQFSEEDSPPLAHLIQSLCLPNLEQYLIGMSDYLDALTSLVEISFLQVVRGATLRSLEWNSDEGCDELTELLLTPGYFPNLKQLLIKCEVVYEEEAEYHRIPSRFGVGLEFELVRRLI